MRKGRGRTPTTTSRKARATPAPSGAVPPHQRASQSSRRCRAILPVIAVAFARQPGIGWRSARLDRNLVENEREEHKNELNRDHHASVLHAVGSGSPRPLRNRVRRRQLARRLRPALASAGKTGTAIKRCPPRGFGLKMSGGLFRQADIGGACAQALCGVRDVMSHDGAAIGRSPAARALAGRTTAKSAASRASRFVKQVGTEANSQSATTRGAGNRQTR